MKRILMLSVAFLLSMGMLFAAAETLGGSQAAEFALNLASGEGLTPSYKAGFSKGPVDAVTDSVDDITSATMTINKDGDAELSADTYVYWQIQSNEALNIKLTWDEKMTGTNDSGNKLTWTVKSVPVRTENATDDGTGSESAIDDKILDRSSEAIANKKFKYATAGSQKLTITVEDAVNSITDDYSGTLTLSINSVGA